MHTFSLMIEFNYIVFDMCRTTKFSSSGRLVHAVLWYFLCIRTKLHVQVFLRKNTWLFETCPRQYNWIKSLMTKVCILLVLFTYTYVYQNARFKKRKCEKLLNPHHTILCTLFIRVRHILGFAAQYFKHCAVFLKQPEDRYWPNRSL
jgi:hypothetical protein